MSSNLVVFKWEADMDALIAHVDKLAGPPSFRTIRELETGLSTAFDRTQEHVHVISGSLKASGRTTSDYNDNEWSAEIVYGGPSAPHDVDYAIYEQARGGTHDFMAGAAEVLDEALTRAIANHMAGR
jgi:hypothetical protein